MRKWLTTVIALSLLTGCSTGPSEPKPAPSSGDTRRPAEGTRLKVTNREVKVKVPDGFNVQHIEFGDASHGYAMFTKCTSGPVCEGRFFATADGGVTWAERPFPVRATSNIQFYVGDAKTIALVQEPHPFQVSTDAGVTWRDGAPTASAYPLEYQLAVGRYGMRESNGQTVPHDFKKGADLAVPVPDARVFPIWEQFAVEETALWLAAVKEGVPVTYVSDDGGKTWASKAVAPQPGREVFNVRIVTCGVRKYGDVFLIADQQPIVGGGGRKAMRGSALKPSGLPLIWKYDLNQGWVPLPGKGLAEKPQRQYAVAPAGEGALFLTDSGPGGDNKFGWLDQDGFVQLDGISAGHVHQLADATVIANAWPSLYLAPGPQNTLEREWIRITLTPIHA